MATHYNKYCTQLKVIMTEMYFTVECTSRSIIVVKFIVKLRIIQQISSMFWLVEINY